MNLAAYRQVLARHGAMAAMHDFIISAVNKILAARIQVVYLLDAPVIHPQQPDHIDIHPLSRAEIKTWVDHSGYELPGHFVDQALNNGDICFGAFINNELLGYAWYAGQPASFSNGLTAHFDTDYAYGYKNLTLPSARGQGIQQWLKFYILDYYRKLEKKGIIAAIDSHNFNSRRSTSSTGAKAIGFWLYVQHRDKYFGMGSKGCKKVGYQLKLTPATTKESDNHHNLRIEVIHDLEQLQRHSTEYEELLKKLPSYCAFYYQIDWMEQLSRLYVKPDRSLYFLLAWRGSSLIGVAPLQIEKKNWARAYLKRLYFLGGISSSLNNMACDFLIPEEKDIAPCQTAFHEFLYRKARKQWDIIELSYLPEQSPSFQEFKKNFTGLKDSRESMQTFLAKLPLTFKEYQNSLNGKDYRELQRLKRKLVNEKEKVEFGFIDQPTPEFLDEIAQLHNNRQEELRRKGKQRHHLFDAKDQKQAILGAIEQTAKKNQFRAYYLKAENRLIAFFVTFLYNKTLHLQLTSFDTGYTRYAPAKLLMMYLVETEIEQRNTKLINTSTGQTKFKQEFCSQVIDHWRFLGINTKPTSQAKYFMWKTITNASNIVKNMTTPIKQSGKTAN